MIADARAAEDVAAPKSRTPRVYLRIRRSSRPAFHGASPDYRRGVTGRLDLTARQADPAALWRVDLFLFTGVATVLVIRTFLSLTGYPQVGGATLHIAHVLWGGLLMALAILAIAVFPGDQWRWRAAFVGGIGFGFFIDEVGKFVTKDVDYFFKPAVAIMYATFVALYVGVRIVLTLRPMTDRRRLALAASALVDEATGVLQLTARDRALAVLDGIAVSSPERPAADLVRDLLDSDVPAGRGVEARLLTAVDRIRRRILATLSTGAAIRIVLALSAVQAVWLLGEVVVSVARHPQTSRAHATLDTGLPATVTAILLVTGVVLLLTGHRESGLTALEWNHIVNLLFVQVAVFNREQFLGLLGFAGSAVALIVIRVARDEVRLSEGAPGA